MKILSDIKKNVKLEVDKPKSDEETVLDKIPKSERSFTKLDKDKGKLDGKETSSNKD